MKRSWLVTGAMVLTVGTALSVGGIGAGAQAGGTHGAASRQQARNHYLK
jgi:hypothetical protein